jgi:hypothetical protein
VIEYVPTFKFEVVKVATPPLSVLVTVLDPLTKFTVPVGVPLPLTGFTVAVKVTDWP